MTMRGYKEFNVIARKDVKMIPKWQPEFKIVWLAYSSTLFTTTSTLTVSSAGGGDKTSPAKKKGYSGYDTKLDLIMRLEIWGA